MSNSLKMASEQYCSTEIPLVLAADFSLRSIAVSTAKLMVLWSSDMLTPVMLKLVTLCRLILPVRHTRVKERCREAVLRAAASRCRVLY